MEVLIESLRRVYGSSVHTLIELLKRPPKRLYARVNTVKCLRETVLELLRREGLDVYLDESIPDAVYFTVDGPYDIECPSDKRIIVDIKTASSLMLGSNLYRPGILKMPSFKEGELLLVATPEGTAVSCVKAVASHEKVLAMDRGLVAVNVSSPFRAPRIAESRAFLKGLIYPQSAPSIITTHLLQPREGMLVVDMNAAPGGKTGHIVQLTRGLARVIAIDRSETKISMLKSTLEKLNLYTNVIPIPADSRYLDVDLGLRNKADRVLIDPPCSNMGVRPIIDYDRTYKDVRSLSEYQKQFLKAAYAILKEGGLLVYSTCTLTLEENEENIVYAVEELGFNVYEPPSYVPYADKVKYKGIVGYRFSPLGSDMPGYFIALLTK